MDKRGGIWGFDVVLWLVRIGVIIMVFIIVLMFENIMLKTSVDFRRAETYLMINALMFSPYGFSVTEGNRVYPGIISLEKFNTETIEKAFYINYSQKAFQDYWGYNLTLTVDGQPSISIVGNPTWYGRLRIIAGTGLTGSGSAIRVIRRYYVMVSSKGELKPGRLTIDIVRSADE